MAKKTYLEVKMDMDRAAKAIRDAASEFLSEQITWSEFTNVVHEHLKPKVVFNCGKE